jgi:DNA polymerase III epsilon subunit-like protein
VPITVAAAAVRGITDQDLVGAPSTAAVLAEFVQVIGHRKVLAYNAPFDHAVLLRDANCTGVMVGALAERARWGCVMRARAAADGGPWQALRGGHRALGDTQAALQVLQDLARRPLLPARRWTHQP